MAQTPVLTISDTKKHLFNFRACSKRHDADVQDKLISPQTKHFSVCCGTGEGSKEQYVFYMKEAEAVLINQLRLPTNGHAQMRSNMLDERDTVSICKGNTENLISLAYVLSVRDFVRSEILQSVHKTIFGQKNDVDGSPSFVQTAQVYINKTTLSLNQTSLWRIRSVSYWKVVRKRFLNSSPIMALPWLHRNLCRPLRQALVLKIQMLHLNYQFSLILQLSRFLMSCQRKVAQVLKT